MRIRCCVPMLPSSRDAILYERQQNAPTSHAERPEWTKERILDLRLSAGSSRAMLKGMPRRWKDRCVLPGRISLHVEAMTKVNCRLRHSIQQGWNRSRGPACEHR